MIGARVAFPLDWGRSAPPAVDVAIIGAGLAGLVAATDLVAKGATVAVFEAKNRPGGRTVGQALPGGGVVDGGGAWVGPTQDAILALADRLNVPTFPTYTGRSDGTLEFLPALPPERQALMSGWKMASGYKAHLVYSTPFWRAAGFNGIMPGGKIAAETFDDTPPEGAPGVILVTADRSSLPKNKDERQLALTEDLVRAFGPLVRGPMAFLEKNWSTDPWNAGCHSVLPPGLLTQTGGSLRRPIDRIHWAGTEMSDRWNGFMDGAVRSGHRAATEVLGAG